MKIRLFKVIWFLSVVTLTLDIVSFVVIASSINWDVYYDFSKLAIFFLLFGSPGFLGLISCYVALGSFNFPKSET
jgi:hypothetical protein